MQTNGPTPTPDVAGLSRPARLMIGATLVTVPTIVYGGLTVLGVVTDGAAGAPAPAGLTDLQAALYRAGHAHAGVLLILSLLLQAFLDHARLPAGVTWSVRVAAPAAAILVSGGFFALAHAPPLRVLLYAGGVLVSYATVVAAVGLLRSLRGAPVRTPASAGPLRPAPGAARG
jgi:hypothetical protein